MDSLRRPNILLILADEQRAPRPYDPPLPLPAQERLRAQGLSLHCHYTASTACAPSRTSLFTGHYPSLHRVSQTDGMAKSAHDVKWLAPDTVPTLGHYLRAAGYSTHYRGKWHISHADLLDAAGTSIPTNDKDGNILAAGVRAYQEADPLHSYGFSGWIGPEPHGADPANTGYVRDPLFTEQVLEQLARLGTARKQDAQPFFLVASLVNPHDIAVYSQLWSTLWRFPWPDDSIPSIPPPPTADEDLSGKPRCQKDYVDKYWRILMPQLTTERYRRFYFWLQSLVDWEVGRILDALERAGLRDNTLVMYTSDHGDMLGAHGGMHQKWHNAYEETVHIPFMISNPVLFPSAVSTTQLTSHIDLLPTILSLAGADISSLQRTLRKTHSVVLPPVGRDLSAWINGSQSAEAFKQEQEEECVYFMSDDQVSDGGSWLELGALKLPYRPVIQPGYVETVVARLKGEPHPSLWKYSRYFDGQKGEKPDEYELYCLTDDPLEQHNLAQASQTTPKSTRARARLDELLGSCRKLRRLSSDALPL
jgi:arylsulfatase A-like enzyme